MHKHWFRNVGSLLNIHGRYLLWDLNVEIHFTNKKYVVSECILSEMFKIQLCVSTEPTSSFVLRYVLAFSNPSSHKLPFRQLKGVHPFVSEPLLH